MSNANALKQRIAEEAGPKNGTDRCEGRPRAHCLLGLHAVHPPHLQTPSTRRSAIEASQIKELVKELESTGSLEDLDLTGTEWDLVYSNSKGSSSGKIGPFVGRVKQVLQKASACRVEDAPWFAGSKVLTSWPAAQCMLQHGRHAGVSG